MFLFLLILCGSRLVGSFFVLFGWFFVFGVGLSSFLVFSFVSGAACVIFVFGCFWFFVLVVMSLYGLVWFCLLFSFPVGWVFLVFSSFLFLLVCFFLCWYGAVMVCFCFAFRVVFLVLGCFVLCWGLCVICSVFCHFCYVLALSVVALSGEGCWGVGGVCCFVIGGCCAAVVFVFFWMVCVFAWAWFAPASFGLFVCCLWCLLCLYFFFACVCFCRGPVLLYGLVSFGFRCSLRCLLCFFLVCFVFFVLYWCFFCLLYLPLGGCAVLCVFFVLSLSSFCTVMVLFVSFFLFWVFGICLLLVCSSWRFFLFLVFGSGLLVVCLRSLGAVWIIALVLRFSFEVTSL